MLLPPPLALAVSKRLQACEANPVLEEQIQLCEAHSEDVWAVALKNEAAAVAQTRAEMEGLGFWGTVGLVAGSGVAGVVVGFVVGILVAQ